MGVIGNLAVNVTANTEKFVKGMKSAQTITKEFEKNTDRLTNAAVGLAAAFAVKFSFEGLKSAAEEMERISLAAKRLGTTSGGLSGLAFAAEQSQLSLEQVTNGLTKLEKGLGTGASADAIKELGLSIEQLRRMGADQQFIAIAGAMDKLPDAAAKTAAAVSLFGKSGAELLPFLAEGPKKIAAMTKEAAELGLVFDDKVASGIEDVNHSFIRLGGAIKGIAREAVVAIGPVAELHANLAKDVLIANRRLLFGTETGPRQDAANKHVNSMSDSNFMDFTKANPIGGMDEFLQKATRERIDSLAKPTAGIGFGPAFASQMMPSMIAMGMQFQKNLLADQAWRELGGADVNRISNAVDELDIAGNAPKEMKNLKRAASQFRGNAALEQGTAAAFSQGKRSQNEGKALDLDEKQLKRQESIDATLKSIDKNLKTATVIEVGNIA